RRHEQPDPEEARIATLTIREREVINLVGLALRNKAIAERLFISEATVRHHLTSIFSKLEVESRLGLVVYSYRYGIIKVSYTALQ
ncbi:MAG TPA: LuxR C-terminal-related transcriptional regulator, partial [Blastocatellia bacterium]|nr:LuxR C-terminal-related transcriptional regulator [Blastocatellia bacterium]